MAPQKDFIMKYFGLMSLLACFLFPGCGHSVRTGDHPVFPVEGVVTYKGKPVEGADVTFFNAEANLSSFGRTDNAGKFRMTTYSSNDGAVAGKQIVTISKMVVASPAQPMPETSSTAYVPPGMGAPSIPVTPQSAEIPIKYASQETSGLVAVIQESGPNEIRLELTD